MLARLRIGIRLKLLFLSLFLFSIPWLGYQYVWELESYLRLGQEQTMVGTARAVATALHERPNLFNKQAAFVQEVTTGKDLYAHRIIDPIQLDGNLEDWEDNRHLSITYRDQYIIQQQQPYEPESVSFRHMVGQYRQYLYAMFEVYDDNVVLRAPDSLRVDRNDHLLISLVSPQEGFKRYIIAPTDDGWVNAYLLSDDLESSRPEKHVATIQGHWRSTDNGYNIEIRLPLTMLVTQIAFALIDVDDPVQRRWKYVIGTADPNNANNLGTVLVPSPEIERIVKGLKYSNARVWVVDNHKRVLARSGSILSSGGFQATTASSTTSSVWAYVEQHWLLPLYYRILTRPPEDFVDELENAYSLKDYELNQALEGEPSSQWRLSPDNKAVILSAAHPIFIEGDVMGAVVVEQTTHGIRTLRNRALEQLFHVILGVIVLGTLALFLFASHISGRITRLRNQTESVIDQHGKIIGNIVASEARDEIGDLSRSFHNVLDKLNQYNSYLENMSSRLSHELRTPIAIVNSSLENLMLNQADSPLDKDSQAYVDRAQQGIKRLSKILSSMSEATRLEHALRTTSQETFDPFQVLSGCTEGYRSAYPERQFNLQAQPDMLTLSGSPELFAQMLDKIIANAVEFSPPHATIGLALQEIAGHPTLRITNPGPLLPEAMQHQLLESMVSVRKPVHSNQPHLGLGLYIARIIAEFHKGKLSIHNLPDGSGVEVQVMF